MKRYKAVTMTSNVESMQSVDIQNWHVVRAPIEIECMVGVMLQLDGKRYYSKDSFDTA